MEIENRPDLQVVKPANDPSAPAPAPMVQKIGAEQLQEYTKILEEYKSGKVQTEQRILASENWWKLRNSIEEQKESKAAGDEGFKAVSGWLHNVIVSKHADAMKAFPEPNILPREKDDKGEALMLSAIIPCILEQNNFEATYSDVQWQKLKTGTGCYKVVWDKSKLNGLGDIHVEKVNLLNVYWEPGVTDIQRSRYFFHTELCDKDVLEERYPQLKGKLKGQSFFSTKFLYDDHVKTENKHTVIEVYYHKYIQGKNTLQYCKYVGDQVIYATENEIQRPKKIVQDPATGMPMVDPNTGMPIEVDAGLSMAERGLYDHGKYPYFFDALFPIEGSPCGYGYVDLCRNPQTEIDMLKTAMVKNAMVGATPRYFSRIDGNIKEEEFLDTTKPIVHVNGNVDEATLRRIEHSPLDGMYVNLLTTSIDELRETSGNTEAATGSTPGSVTAASGIAALQEAAGKTSSDSTQSSYRVYSDKVDMIIELIRQFYDMPRKFRILGQYGMERYVTYTNQGIQPQHQGNAFGQDMGFRLPVFDIKVSAQKKNVYTKVAQNELALQFFQLGFFNPQMVDQSLMCLEMMDFDDKDIIMQKISQMGTMHQKLIQYMQLALGLAQKYEPATAQQIAQDVIQFGGGTVAPMGMGMGSPQIAQADNIGGVAKEEHAVVRNARQQSNDAAQPNSDGVIADRGKK
jgi:hypothetical protein